jgi:hydroxyacyl-ACP dehydratase HTD2-like protein with hotdog domain
MTAPGTTVNFSDCKAGDNIPQRELDCSNVQLMLYNAVLWNGHRIHFDEPYARDVEGYAGLVIAGPLLGDWLHQCIEEWLADGGRIVSIDYSNRLATYVGDTLTSGAIIRECDQNTKEIVLDVFVKNEEGLVVAPGEVVVRFD